MPDIRSSDGPSTGEQAVEMTASLRPDVVLMDIRLPGIDGIEATRRIQDQCPTPVVALTAHEDLELVEEATQAGVGAYLIKPPDIREIHRAIKISMARFRPLEIAADERDLRGAERRIGCVRTDGLPRS